MTLWKMSSICFKIYSTTLLHLNLMSFLHLVMRLKGNLPLCWLWSIWLDKNRLLWNKRGVILRRRSQSHSDRRIQSPCQTRMKIKNAKELIIMSLRVSSWTTEREEILNKKNTLFWWQANQVNSTMGFKRVEFTSNPKLDQGHRQLEAGKEFKKRLEKEITAPWITTTFRRQQMLYHHLHTNLKFIDNLDQEKEVATHLCQAFLPNTITLRKTFQLKTLH